MKKMISLVLSLTMICCAVAIPASAAEEEMYDSVPMQEISTDPNDRDLEKTVSSTEFNIDIQPLDEDAYTQSVPATRVGATPRVGNDIGRATAEYNSIFNWGRAISEVWGWATATYLGATATVTADDCTDEIDTVSSTTKQKIMTNKVYQSVRDGRTLYTDHTIEGYENNDSNHELKTEFYSANKEF